jgi:hypothetical protein
MVPLGSSGNNFRNEVPSENVLAGTQFLTVIYRGTFFIARIPTGCHFFLQLILNKTGSPLFP